MATRIGRKQFINHSALTAVLAPVVWNYRPALAQASEDPKAQQHKVKLTAKQDEDVKKTVARRDEQLASTRGRTLPYDLEPAFVFSAWTRPRADRKPGSVR